MPLTPDELRDRYSTHTVSGDASSAMQAIRDNAMLMAMHINDACPDSREKALAHTHLEEVMMWAVKSIATHGLAEGYVQGSPDGV